MAQIMTLTDRQSGKPIYPVTSTKAVFGGNGEDLDALLAGQKQAADAALSELSKDLTKQIDQKQETLTESPDIMPDGTQLSLTERAKRAVFDDLFTAAAGTWGRIDYTHVENGVSKPYCLNGLWLTYEEALAVYNAGAIDTPDCTLRYAGAKIKTNLPVKCGSYSFGSSTDHKFFVAGMIQDSDIGILNLNTRFHDFCIQYMNGSNVNITAFSGAKLREIMGVIDLGGYVGENSHRIFGSCPVLEDVQLQRLGANLDLSGCPKINAASVRYMVTNSRVMADRWVGPYKTKGEIVITLHADTYAKLTAAVDDPDNEWYGLIDLAAEKKITFACA